MEENRRLNRAGSSGARRGPEKGPVISAATPDPPKNVAFVVLAEVESALAAGQSCVYPEDIRDRTGLTWKQVQEAGTELARVGLVDVVTSAHFGVLRFVGMSGLAAGVVRAVRRQLHRSGDT